MPAKTGAECGLPSGDPPACSQLKGPEIAAWSKIAPTVNLDAIVAAAGYEKVVAPDLAKLHKPGGKWDLKMTKTE